MSSCRETYALLRAARAAYFIAALYVVFGAALAAVWRASRNDGSLEAGELRVVLIYYSAFLLIFVSLFVPARTPLLHAQFCLTALRARSASQLAGRRAHGGRVRRVVRVLVRAAGLRRDVAGS